MKKCFFLTALMFAATLSAQERAAWMPEEATNDTEEFLEKLRTLEII